MISMVYTHPILYYLSMSQNRDLKKRYRETPTINDGDIWGHDMDIMGYNGIYGTVMSNLVPWINW